MAVSVSTEVPVTCFLNSTALATRLGTQTKLTNSKKAFQFKLNLWPFTDSHQNQGHDPGVPDSVMSERSKSAGTRYY